jgi:hypothetical protein
MTYEYKLGILILKSLLILEQGDNERRSSNYVVSLKLPRILNGASKNTQR